MFRFVGSIGTIIVKCKDLRVIQLDVPGMEECLNIGSSIEVSKLINATFSLQFLSLEILIVMKQKMLLFFSIVFFLVSHLGSINPRFGVPDVSLLLSAYV